MSVSRQRCYRTAPSLPEQARRIADSLRLHPGRTVADYGATGALAVLVEQMRRKEERTHGS